MHANIDLEPHDESKVTFCLKNVRSIVGLESYQIICNKLNSIDPIV